MFDKLHSKVHNGLSVSTEFNVQFELKIVSPRIISKSQPHPKIRDI